MPSSPRTSPYDLRSRKKSPDGKHISKREASQTLPSSQSESSDTEYITSDDGEQNVQGQENKSLHMAADETDAGISCASNRNANSKEISKDSHVDKSGAEIKRESEKVHNTRQNNATGKQRSNQWHQGDIKNNQNEYISCPWQICIILSIILLMMLGLSTIVLHVSSLQNLGIYVLSSLQANNQNSLLIERPVPDRMGNLTTELERIKAKYTSLDNGFWDVIAGSSWAHIQGDGSFKQPVVLLLVGQPKSTYLDVVANDVAGLYSNVFTMRDDSTVHIDGSQQATKEADQAKLDMDNLLQNGFHNGKKVVLVTKFDKLPPCSIMLFHSYCDNENAPHKDAVIIFTVELERTVSHADDVEELVQEHLGTVWAQCPEELLPDKIVAMHSRVSNNIAFVK